MKDEILEMLNDKVNDVYLQFQEKLNIRSGDITPLQLLKQDELIQQLAEVIDEVLKMEREWQDESSAEC